MADGTHPHTVLVGLSGTGKTSIGRLAAERLHVPFVDTDEEIERRAGRSVRDIFAADGEERFRALEADVVADVLARREQHVVAAGGGAVVTARTRDRLHGDDVFVVWLTAEPAFLASRAAGKAHRPLLDDDPVGTLTRLAGERRAWFDDVAGAVVDVQPALTSEPKPRAKARLADVVTDMVRLREARRTRDHLVLVGAMGAGKSTVGPILAARRHRPFVDSDELIERWTGRTARQIAAGDGLSALHQLELRALREPLDAAAPSVIGAAASVVDESIGRLLVGTAREVVWLRADPEVLRRRRPSGGHRPTIDPAIEAARPRLYASVATTIVDVDDLAPEVIADKVPGAA